MANRVSRQTYKALRAFAKAVRAVTDIYDLAVSKNFDE